MTERFANTAQTTLNGAIDNSTTTVVVTSAAAFPTLGNFRILIDSELLLVTSVSSNTFTVSTRGTIESTAAASHSNGATVTHVLTAGGLAVAISEGVGGGTEMALDYAQITSNASITATTEATADTVVTGAAITYDGATEIVVEFYSPFCRPDTTANNRELRLYLYDGSSSIGRLSLQIAGEGGGSSHVPVHVRRKLTPSAGSHTYSIRAAVNVATGLVGAGAGGSTADMPAYIRIVKSIPAASGASVQTNEVRNFPSLENANDAQPEWWEESAGTATLTEVDLAGEGITESWERALKLVTTADVYALQTYTYADEKRLKSGKTVSARVAVWSVGGVTARVRLQSTVGSLGVATTTAAAWTVLTVEAVVLDGTAVDLRLEVNNGTAYFVPLAFGVGSSAPNELPPRGLAYRIKDDPSALRTMDGLNDEATWTDVDCTSPASALAVIAQVGVSSFEGTSDFRLYARRNGSSTAASDNTFRTFVGPGATFGVNEWNILLDDQQIYEYFLDRTSGSSAIDFATQWLRGWWEWE